MSILRQRTLIAAAVATLAWALSPLARAALPPGFVEEPVATGWNQVVGILFAPEGETFVWERTGVVWTVTNGQRATFLDISDEVGGWRDYGLLGFALDPQFYQNGWVYLLYVVDRHHLLHAGTPGYDPATNEYFAATIGRITRYRATRAPGRQDYRGATGIDPASRQILLGESAGTGFPIIHQSHGVGALFFATDGTLIASCGDGASYSSTDVGSAAETYWQDGLADGIITPEENVGAFRSQMLESLNGKILRLDPDTGDGLASNPWYDASSPRSSRSRVWALGLRNPCRVTLRPETGSHDPTLGDPGVFYIGDVGWNSREDLHVCDAPGQNFGWPLFEGMTQASSYWNSNTYHRHAPNPLYDGVTCTQEYFYFRDLIQQDSLAPLPSLPNPCSPSIVIPSTIATFVHVRPPIDWRGNARAATYSGNTAATVLVGGAGSPVSGPQFSGNCSIGGVWYTGHDFPAAYHDTYFHADYGGAWIKNFVFDENDQPSEVRDFLTDRSVVFVTTHPTQGELYYVSWQNEVYRIRYVSSTNEPPTAVVSQDFQYGASPLTVSFDAGDSVDPEGQPLTWSWNFGDGSAPSTAQAPIHTFVDATGLPRAFTVTLTVTDPGGLSDTESVIISVNNTPPVIISTSVDDIHSYAMAGDTTLDLSAVVSDAEHATSSLSFEWQTTLVHDNHSHPEPIDTNEVTTAVISPVGCDGILYYYEVSLRVTDPAGLSAEVVREIYPDCGGGPIAVNDRAIVEVGSSVIVDPLANDLGAVDPTSLSIIDQPRFGTISIGAATGRITFVHDGSPEGEVDRLLYTVRDAFGVESNVAAVWFTVGGPPTVRIVSPTDGATIVGSDIAVEYESYGDIPTGYHVEISLDAGPPVHLGSLAGTHIFSGVTPGVHTVAIDIVDRSDEPLGTPESHHEVSVTVEAAPDVTVVGSAVADGACVILTPAANNQTGAVWLPSTVDLSESFHLEFDIHLGANDGGADGMAFVLQGIGPSALGGGGGGMGLSGLSPSFAVEFDTWNNGTATEIASDHVAIVPGGNLGAPVAGPVCASASCANVEDGADHRVVFDWDPDAGLFAASFDGAQRVTYSGDLAVDFFGGGSNVWLGWTAATGGANNVHRVCFVELTFGDPPPPNTEPTIVSTPPLLVAEGAAYLYDVDALDDDPGDSVSYALLVGPVGSSIDVGSGLITWATTSADIGTHSFHVLATDQGELSDEQLFVVTVTNIDEEPTITSTPPLAGTENVPYSYLAEATDPDAGDVVTFSLAVGPSGASIDFASGLLEWTPTSQQIGPHAFTIRATDTTDLFAEQSFVVTVAAVDERPTITSSPPLSATVGATYAYDVTATDPDPSDDLTYSLEIAPPAATIDPDSGAVRWTPGSADIGSHPVIVRATDSTELFDEQSFVITVGHVPPSQPPLFLAGVVPVVDSASWRTVDLGVEYASMVVICTPVVTRGMPPVVVRVRNAEGSSFQVKLARADLSTGTVSTSVHWLVVEEGIYTETVDGIRMEAVRFLSTRSDNAASWVGTSRSYLQSYSQPVVLGQVLTENDPRFGVFWSRGVKRGDAPDATTLVVGRHSGEDFAPRGDETIGYIVFETGAGTIGDVRYAIALGADTIQGIDNAPPFAYQHERVVDPTAAILSIAGIDAGNGGWPVLWGAGAVGETDMLLAIDEDQVWDLEREHTTESVAYAIFGAAPADAPVVESFDASPSAIPFGGSATLSWSVTGAGGVDISGVGTGLPAAGSAVVSPTATTTYELSATNVAGTATAEVTISVETPTTVLAETGVVDGVGTDSWTTVALSNSYVSPIVVCTPVLASAAAPPIVIRVRAALGTSFEMSVARMDASTAPVTGIRVHWFVIEEGVYTPEVHGVKLEAVRYESVVTDRDSSWIGESRAYQNSYSSPVVLGQVLTANDPSPSAFWCRGASRLDPPNASTLFTGKHVGEDPLPSRGQETIGYVVIEAGAGTLGDLGFIAGLGPDIVLGTGDRPPYTYSVVGLSSVTSAVATLAGMDGGNGGWAVLYGDDPVAANAIRLAIDEDRFADPERNHTTEQVGYVIFGR